MGCVRAAWVLAVIAASINLSEAEVSCGKDGLYTDYASECRDYVRCSSETITGRYSCGPERAFSAAVGACVARSLHPCVKITCAPKDTSAYAAPATSCRHYYQCDNGTAIEHACPLGAWFDSERQGCTRGAGACYEPICAGLVNGYHSDVSHDCRRRIECLGGALKAVTACPGGSKRCPEDGKRCPAPRTAAVALPTGEADFCSDDACSSLCQLAEDGAHADRSTGCREYFVCSARRVTRRGVCDAGSLFSSAGCEPAEAVVCPKPARGRCFGRADGAYRDWRDCRSWYACRRDRVVARGSCDEHTVWDGADCVHPSRYHCEGPVPSTACTFRPSGFYQDLDSDCESYYHCDGIRRTNLRCPEGRIFNGVECVYQNSYLCPSLDPDSCYRKSDGLYHASSSGCRGYYACNLGEKSIYACKKGLVFNGETCVDSTSYDCPDDYSCAGLANGYHRDIKSGCRNYFYCEAGDKIATLTCFGSKIYNGKSCVDPKNYSCGANQMIGFGDETENICAEDGFFVQAGTSCKSYYYCIGGARTSMSCPKRQLFNGQLCVPSDSYTCPGG